MAYRISFSLQTLDESPIVLYALTPEDAALQAWKLCKEHKLGVPHNRAWKMKVWDSMEGEYETFPVADEMIRGGVGKYPDQEEFTHTVLTKITIAANDEDVQAALFARTRMPFHREPGGKKQRFEMFQNEKERMSIEFDKEAQWSVVNDFETKLDDTIARAKAGGGNWHAQENAETKIGRAVGNVYNMRILFQFLE